jgi:2-polyprenyl-6-methoxyphenol hydroxylase-like FAD-dependent oxidoreductase
MAKKTALISGAGIAGPTLAYWLWRRGFEPVLIEGLQSSAQAAMSSIFGVSASMLPSAWRLIPTLRELGYVNDRIAFVRQDGGLRSAKKSEAKANF